MTNFLRMTAAAAVLALGATPALAASPDKNATATARIIKPLKLYWVQDLDLGTVLLSGAGSWTGAQVAISRTGTFTCTNTNVSCSGNTQAAKYRVTGTNNQVVTVTAPNVELTNANDTTKKLTLVVDNPGTVTMPNAGTTGAEFGLGGAITINSDTLDGVYSGAFNVTVDY